MSVTTRPKPRAIADLPVLGHHGRVWLLIGDEYADVSSLVARASVEATFGGPTTLTIEIPVAATGTPEDFA